MPVLNNIQAVNYALMQEMERDPSVVVFGEDVGYEGGVFRATVDLQAKFGVERCFDTPISESGIVGMAVGMAINGLKPVVELQFCGFTYPAFNQIISHVARMRNRSRGRYTLPMVIRFPFGGGIRALEHHSESPEVLFAHIPGLKVVAPSTPYETKGLLLAALRDPDPVIFMEPKKIYRAFKQDVPEDDYVIEIGKANVVKEGEDLTIVTWGSMVRDTLKAVEKANEKGIHPEVIDLRTISPIDQETVIKSVKKTGRILVVQEAVKSFGVASEIITFVNEKAFMHLEAPPARVTAPDIIVPLPRGEQFYMPHPDMIYEKINEVVNFLT